MEVTSGGGEGGLLPSQGPCCPREGHFPAGSNPHGPSSLPLALHAGLIGLGALSAGRGHPGLPSSTEADPDCSLHFSGAVPSPGVPPPLFCTSRRRSPASPAAGQGRGAGEYHDPSVLVHPTLSHLYPGRLSSPEAKLGGEAEANTAAGSLHHALSRPHGLPGSPRTSAVPTRD